MNQLSNNVIDLARYRRARTPRAAGPRLTHASRARRVAHLPVAARRRDRSAHLRLGFAEGRARSAASFATLSGKLKDPQHERRPEAARRIRF